MLHIVASLCDFFCIWITLRDDEMSKNAKRKGVKTEIIKTRNKISISSPRVMCRPILFSFHIRFSFHYFLLFVWTKEMIIENGIINHWSRIHYNEDSSAFSTIEQREREEFDYIAKYEIPEICSLRLERTNKKCRNSTENQSLVHIANEWIRLSGYNVKLFLFHNHTHIHNQTHTQAHEKHHCISSISTFCSITWCNKTIIIALIHR